MLDPRMLHNRTSPGAVAGTLLGVALAQVQGGAALQTFGASQAPTGSLDPVICPRNLRD